MQWKQEQAVADLKTNSLGPSRHMTWTLTWKEGKDFVINLILMGLIMY